MAMTRFLFKACRAAVSEYAGDLEQQSESLTAAAIADARLRLGDLIARVHADFRALMRSRAAARSAADASCRTLNSFAQHVHISTSRSVSRSTLKRQPQGSL
jgi:hypothetical protein